jgi:hypothetical protein
MRPAPKCNPVVAALVGVLAFSTVVGQPADELPSWNDGQAKQTIVDFVAKVRKPGSSDFVPVAQRIAVFDNDGTLWAEHPLYFQFLFAIDRAFVMIPIQGLAAKFLMRDRGAVEERRTRRLIKGTPAGPRSSKNGPGPCKMKTLDPQCKVAAAALLPLSTASDTSLGDSRKVI